MKKLFAVLAASLACVCFTACTPFSVEKAEEKMEEAGYTVIAYKNEEAEGLTGGLVATKISLTEGVDILTAAYFETTEDAKAFYEELGESSAVQEGKWVYWGDEDAIEDFKK